MQIGCVKLNILIIDGLYTGYVAPAVAYIKYTAQKN